MAQYANGQLRFAARDSNLNYKAGAKSAPAQYDLWDNASAPRIVFSDAVQRTLQGTSDDQLVTTPASLFADGSKGEFLDLEFMHTAAMTPATASHNVRLLVADIYRNGEGRLVVEDRLLGVSDRCTAATAATQNDPNGWPDNQATVAKMWTPVLRFKPALGHRYAPRGPQYAVIDGA